MTWYILNTHRHRLEREALESLASTVSWLTPIGWRIDDRLRLIWDADVTAGENVFSICMRYPNHFPFSPPLVLPRDSREWWSSHQYGAGGELCLEYGPDNWHPDLTGADMVQSAYRLFEGERLSTEEQISVPTRHASTLGQELRNKFSRFLMTRAFSEVLSRIPDGVLLSAQVVSLLNEETYVAIVSSLVLPDGVTWADEIPKLANFGFERPAALFRWPIDAALPSTESLTAFRASTAERNLDLPDCTGAIVVQGTTIHYYWFATASDSANKASVIHQPQFSPRLDISHADLAARKVAMVGCGSLGSKLAVILARSGLRKFFLVDDDIFFPDNLVRHELDWRDVGTHKVDSVASKIKLVAPDAVCERRRHRLGGQEASGSLESVIEAIGDCDLIVDATANPSVFNYLCAAVAVSNKPLVWGEVFAGGYGGLVARHRPSLDPSPASMRRIIENWCAEQGRPIERAANDYEGGGDAPHIADDADVSAIAAPAARMAIDLLIPRNPSLFPHSVYFIGLAKGWIFEQPFETHPIDVGPPESVDPGSRLNPTEHEAEIERILKLFNEHKNAATSDTQGDETTSA